MKRIILIFFLILINEAHSKCNFATGKYLKEISDPSKILSIKIDIPNSFNYSRNIYRILVSDENSSKTIPKKLKKKFKANLLVNYKFGVCKYLATIRQSGDWKDHIMPIGNGNYARSLDVKLKDGNIMNAVSFKLLLPKTRNGNHEILASLILKKLGFIAPETFEVNTTVNNVDSVLLFQEKPQKELLEKNLRREGPIFEGDESLLWGYDRYSLFELEPLSLSRLINDKWLKKGESSRKIALKSFAELQESYLQYSYRFINNYRPNLIFPNKMKSDKFLNFYSLLASMGGTHGMRPHNQQYYYNSLESSFEPIYYDGNISFETKLVVKPKNKNFVYYEPDSSLIRKVYNLIDDNILYEDFFKRTIKKKNLKYFFKKSITQFHVNLKNIELNTGVKNNNMKTFNNIDFYRNFQASKKLNQKIINNINIKNDSQNIINEKGESFMITEKDLQDLLSKNQLQNKRTVYIPVKKHNVLDKEIKYFNSQEKIIKMSKNMRLKIDEKKKILYFNQLNPSDWALISKSDYSNWKIFFNGKANTKDKIRLSKQRLNNHGLTGCLTIYNSIINKTSISIINGGCEDSINIINSVGEDLNLIVENAAHDAFDGDFSKISIESIKVTNSGNDCADLSGGEYDIKIAYLDNCTDKAVSVGEKSLFYADKVFVNKSNIAISSKDFSSVSILYLEGKQVNLCAEIKQKKQEFGGASLSIEKNKCKASINSDSMSTFLENN